jgi:hypothetical protein
MAVSGLVLVVLGLASVLAVPFLVLMAMGLAHQGANITYVNGTAHTLRIYEGESDFEFELKPFETRTFSTYKHSWNPPTVARTGDGRVVFSVDLTWDELKAQDYRIVIEEQGGPP